MRFFSNDARESTDPDNDPQAGTEHPERVHSDPVTVPAQRPPSPWSNPPADDTVNDAAEPTHHDSGTASYGTVTPPPAETERWEPDDSVATTYESTTSRDPHGAHAADTDEVDLPLDDDSNERPKDTTASAQVAADEDPARDDSVTGEADREGTVPDETTDDDTKASENGLVKDETLKDEGGFDDPRAVDPATDETLEPVRDESDTPAAESTPDAEDTPDAETAHDEPVVAAAPGATDGPENPPASDYAPTTDDDSTPVAAAVPVAAATTPAASAPASASGNLFDADDARAYQERWRDVQLRFVDSPKEAADEAGALVSEAVDKLTASLNAQKDGLADDTDDTERLRVQIRGYRDILNRILSL